MPSDFDRLFAEAAVPELMAQFGERLVDGDAPVRYYEPPYQSAAEWRGVIVGQVQLTVEEEFGGSHVRTKHRERVAVMIPTPPTPILRTALLEIAACPGEKFSIERFERTAGITRIECVRDAVESLQSRTMERGQ